MSSWKCVANNARQRFCSCRCSIAAQAIECLSGKGSRPKTEAALRAAIVADLKKWREKQKTVVVMIDDIDRLPARKIRLLFQLVTVNADFPNLVYLLLFDKAIAAQALADLPAVQVDDGPRIDVKIDRAEALRGDELAIDDDVLTIDERDVLDDVDEAVAAQAERGDPGRAREEARHVKLDPRDALGDGHVADIPGLPDVTAERDDLDIRIR